MAKLNPKKMKVAELKTELEARNIEVAKGLKKADLVAMLMSALENDENNGEDTLLSEEEEGDLTGGQETDNTAEDDSVLLADDEPAEELQQKDDVSEERESSPFEVLEPVTPEESNVPEQIQQEEEKEEKMVVEDAVPEPPTSNGTPEEETEMEAETPEEEPSEPATDAAKEEEAEKVDEGGDNNAEAEPPAGDDAEPKQEENDAEQPDEEKQEDEEEDDSKREERSEEEDRRRDRRDRSDGGHRHDSHGSRKRRHDDHDRHHRRYEERYAPPPEEPEEEFDDALVVLDKYNSDLNLKLHRDRLTGQPLTLEGFAYLWAGARATYGVKSGKVCYECKMTEEHSVRHLPSTEPNRHLVRLGWSRDLSTRMLGESELSFAYCGTGKKVTDETVEDYGETFKQGDVITSYLDFTGEESVTIGYAKNGVSLDVAFTIEKEKLAEEALFPHVMSKNTTVELNFGQKETPFFPHPEGFEDYVFIGAVPIEDRTRGIVGATARKDCQVLMMCGLPGAGKTYYVENYAKEHPEMNYSILGTHSLMSRMKASGLECKASRETLVNHATNCLNRLFQVACRKKRNFILDQTNVYASAQRRRMRTFEGYKRKALILVPSDDDFKERSEKRSKEQGKDLPEFAIDEMKVNFTFPEVGDLFEEVEYLEQDHEEASKLIEEYRAEARKKGPPAEKRFRGGFDTPRQHSGRGGGNFGAGIMDGRPPMRGGMGGGYGGGNFGRYGNQRTGGYRDGRGDRRGGGGQWNKGGQGGGNWQQNRNMGGGGRGGGFQGGNRGGYGGNRSGGGFNRNSFGGTGGTGANGNRMNQNRNQNQANRTNFNQNRNQSRGGGAGGAGGSAGGQRGGGQTQSSNPLNYHQAYQQQAAQFSSQSAQASQMSTAAQYQQQAYNPQAQQQDYSQQWAQYYQQQAAAQQQQAAAAAAAQYQNYYAYQNAYANPAAPPTKPQ